MEPVIRRTRGQGGEKANPVSCHHGTSALVTDEEALCKAEESRAVCRPRVRWRSRDGVNHSQGPSISSHMFKKYKFTLVTA